MLNSFTSTEIHRINLAYVPAVLAAIWSKLRRAHREVRTRHAIARDLSSLSENKLRDIGLVKSDVTGAIEQPVSEEAGDYLSKRTIGRASNW